MSVTDASIGILTRPLLSLMVGVDLSYVVALLFGMLVVFLLPRRGWMIGCRIDAMVVLPAVGVLEQLERSIRFVSGPRRADLVEFVSSQLYIARLIIPNILLSVRVFS